MDLKQMFLTQLGQESAATRRTLERVSERHNDWKPHEKSMTLGYLAGLVASMPSWAEFMIERDELDLNDPSADRFKARAVESRIELLKMLDDGLLKSRKALERTSDEHLQRAWRFIRNGQILFDAPQYVARANLCFCHMAHHRGPRTVSLRLNAASVPAIYGSSAGKMH